MAKQKTIRLFYKNRLGNGQMQMLVSYMEQHSFFARAQITKLGPQGHEKYKSMWAKLSAQLNEIGPCKKTVEQWKKAPEANISELDERVSQIFGNYGTGLSIVKELGCFTKEKPQSDVRDDAWFNGLQQVTVKLQILINKTPYIMDYVLKFINNVRYLHEGCNGDEKRTMLKPTNKQMDILVDFMERHPDLANDMTEDSEDLWNVLVTLLNSAGGVVKCAKSWKKTWTDLVASARQNFNFTTIGLKNTPLPDKHCRVLNLVGYNKAESKSVKLVKKEPNLISQPQALNMQPPMKRARNVQEVDLTDEPSTSTGITSNSGARQKNLPASTVLSTNTSGSSSMAGSALRTSNTSVPAYTSTRIQTSPARATADKSSKFIKSFEEKGAELVMTLANQFTSCFEKQNEVLMNCFQVQSSALLESLPTIIAREFATVLQKNELAPTVHQNESPDDIQGPNEASEEVLEEDETELKVEASDVKKEEADFEYGESGIVQDFFDESELYDEEYLDESLLQNYDS